jgi:serine/threonine protein kinase
MKVLEKGKFKRDVLKHYVNTEVEVTKTLNSENIVKLYENFETRLNYYLILEFCN